MQAQKVIELLGYSANEAKVYLATLNLGEANISDIAAKAKLPRTSAQVIIDKLHKDGLVNFYVQRRYKYWVAENPERLLDKLKQREDVVRAALPQFANLRKTGRSDLQKPAAKIFTGRDEIRLILDDIIETKRNVLAIVPEDAFAGLFEGTTIFEDFTASRVRNNLRMRILASDTKFGRMLAERAERELRDIRFLPSHLDIKTASFMYGDKVALITFNQRQPTAVLIEDPALRETKTMFFEELWNESGRKKEGSPEKEKEGLFTLLANASPQPLLIASERAEIVYVNAAWEKQFGYSLEEVKGQNPRMLQSGKTPREVYERMWESLKAGQSFQSDEIIDKKKNGSFFNLLTTIFPMKSDGKTFYVQILDDITQRKRVETMRKNFLVAAAETSNAPIANFVQTLLDDASFE